MTLLVEELRVRRLRGVREAHLEGLAQVNVLIGRNGAGKSTILEAVYAASAWVKVRDAVHGRRKLDYIVERRGSRGSWGSARDILWFSMDVSKPIEVELGFSTGKSMLFKLVHSDGEGYTWLQLPDELRRKLGPLSPYGLYNYGSDRLLDPVRGTITGSGGRGFLFREAYTGEIGFLSRVLLIDSWLLRSPSLVEKAVWPRLLARRLDKRLVELVREGFEPGAEGLTYMPLGGDYVLAVQLPETTVRVDDLGDGARSALLTSALLLTLRDTAVLVEEPEAHLHPGGLATLLEFTLKLCKERGLQAFITTHSIELVNMAVRLSKELGVDAKTFYLERDGEGVVDARQLTRVDLEVLQGLGLDPRLLHVI